MSLAPWRGEWRRLLSPRRLLRCLLTPRRLFGLARHYLRERFGARNRVIGGRELWWTRDANALPVGADSQESAASWFRMRCMLVDWLALLILPRRNRAPTQQKEVATYRVSGLGQKFSHGRREPIGVGMSGAGVVRALKGAPLSHATPLASLAFAATVRQKVVEWPPLKRPFCGRAPPQIEPDDTKSPA